MPKKNSDNQEYKTKEYTRRAIQNYRKKFDIINLNLNKGERDEFRRFGLNNAECVRILRAELERRQAAAELPDADELPTFEP